MGEKFKPHTYIGETPHDFERPYQTNEVEPVVIPPEGILAVAAVREVIFGIDYQIVLDIFREEYGKSGIDPDTLTLVPRSRIQIVYESEELFRGRYTPFSEVIQINAVHHYADTCSNRERILHTFIHEQLHHSSTAHIEQASEAEQLSIGVEKNTYDPESGELIKKTDAFLDEGLTEILTSRLLQRYLGRTGTSIANSVTEKTLTNGFNLDNYTENQKTLRRLILFYSVLTDIPEPEIENVFLRTYLRNGSLFPQEMNEITHEVPDSSTRSIRASDMGTIIDCLEQGTLDEGDWRNLVIDFLPQEKRIPFLERLRLLMQREFAVYEKALQSTKDL